MIDSHITILWAATFFAVAYFSLGRANLAKDRWDLVRKLIVAAVNLAVYLAQGRFNN